MKELMILFFQSTFQMFSLQLQSTKLEFGMLKIGNNFWEFKSQALNVIVSSLCMMANLLFQDGVTVKSEHFYLNLENYCMWSMMLIITDAHQSQLHQMEQELFQEVLKVKLESGKYPNKHKLWKLHLNNTEAEFGQFKLTKIIHKQFQQVVMVHALFGTWKLIQECFVFLNRLLSNKPYSTPKNTKFLQLVQIEK